MTAGWHRLGLLALLSAALLVCAAEPEQRPTQRDARKLRYGDRQQGAEETVAPDGTPDEPNPDPSKPLSLLPPSAEPQTDDAPNRVPTPGDLSSGVNASRELSVPAEQPTSGSGAFAAVVRSVTRDGRAYGDARVNRLPVGEELFVPDEPVLARQQSAPVNAAGGSPAGLPSLRGGTAIPGLPVAAASKPAEPKPTQTKPAQPKPTEARPTEAKLLAKTPPPAKSVADKPAASQPAAMPANPSTQKPASGQGVTPRPAPTQTAEPQQIASSRQPTATAQNSAIENDTAAAATSAPSADGFGWLSRALSGDASHHEQIPVESLTVPAEPELAIGALEGGLGIPTGRPVPVNGRGSRVARWLLGLSGVCVLALVLIALPRPRRRTEGDRIIETIELEGGRRLVIAARKHYALVLGETERSLHLLEKVAMHRLSGEYRETIDAIIARETEQTELWRMRPVFTSLLEPAYTPETQARSTSHTSIAELRAQLEVLPARGGEPAVRRRRMTHIELVEAGSGKAGAQQDHYGERVPVLLQGARPASAPVPRSVAELREDAGEYVPTSARRAVVSPLVVPVTRRSNVSREAVKSRLREQARTYRRAS